MTLADKLLDLVVELSGLVLCGMALLMLYMGPRSDRRIRRYFFFLFFGCIMLTAANIAGLLMRGLPGSGWHAALCVSNYVEFLIPDLLAGLFTFYLLSVVDSEKKLRRMRCGVLFLVLLHITLLTVSQFTGLYYVIGPDNLYRRRPFYPLCFVCSALILLNDLAVVLKYRDRLTRKEFTVFLIYITVPAVGMLLQGIQYGINFSVFSTIAAALVMYLFVLSDQTERYEREQRANARRELDILMLQMRPHFIYNTMMSIYFLCETDPLQAQKVCGDFAAYMQGTFLALSRHEPIAFSEELAHTHAYLAVEQARYEDMIFAEFDTPDTAFRLPALTLQPLVENAIKHGFDPERGPIHIRVSAHALDGGHELTVEDDGVGLPAEPVSTAPGALENIRSRLAFAGGSLELSARDGGGARVRLWIPQIYT